METGPTAQPSPERRRPEDPEKLPQQSIQPEDSQSSPAPRNSGDEELGQPDESTRVVLPFSKGRLIALVLTVTGAAFLNTLGVQAAVIILPTLGADLKVPDSRQQWIISAYSLTFGCFLLLWGRLADVYGKRLVFICGSAWFAVTSAVLPFVNNEIGFNVFRALQGLGAAANVPTAIGILGVTFPPSKAKNYAFSCYGAGAPLGAIFGNLLGGVVAEYLSWKWVFGILAILAAIVTTAGFLLIPVPPAQTETLGVKSAVDWVGATIITCGLLALMFALTEGNVVGWGTPWISVVIVISIVLIVLFAVWQWYLENKTTRRPLMKISIWKNYRFSAAMVIMAFFFAAFNNYLVFVSYYFQDYLGLSVIQTTIRFIPTGVSGLLTAFVTANLLSRVPGNYILLFGTMSVAIACLLLATPIPPATTYWAYCFPAMVLSVFGADTVYPSLTLFTAHSLPQEDQALGGALINSVGQIGRSIGLAIATAVQTAVIAHEKRLDVSEAGSLDFEDMDSALLKGLRSAEWVSFGFAITSFAVVAFAFRGSGILGGKH